jgi:hypothetical protein
VFRPFLQFILNLTRERANPVDFLGDVMTPQDLKEMKRPSNIRPLHLFIFLELIGKEVKKTTT